VFKKETFKKNKFAILYTSSSWTCIEDAEKYVPHDIKNYKEDIIWSQKYEAEYPSKYKKDAKDPMVTAWDEGSFGVGVMGIENVMRLEEIYNALQKQNLTIARMNPTPNNPFSNASLSLLITDKIPQEFIDAMYDADKNYQDLIDYEEKIGMTKIKAKYDNKNGYHGHGYYSACSAKWIDYDDAEEREAKKKELGTKYDIRYWVNYSDDDSNSGWFNVEEIKEWLTGTKKLTEIHPKDKK